MLSSAAHPFRTGRGFKAVLWASFRLQMWLQLNLSKWEFPKIRGTLLGVPIIRTIVFWDLD